MVLDQIVIHRQEHRHTNYQFDIDIVYVRRFPEQDNRVYHTLLYSYEKINLRISLVFSLDYFTSYQHDEFSLTNRNQRVSNFHNNQEELNKQLNNSFRLMNKLLFSGFKSR